jgi:hypothetical protein
MASSLRVIGVLILWGAATRGAIDQGGTTANHIPVLTVCDALRNPVRYGGQVVIIVGRSIGTSEGSWLDEDCGLKLNIEGRAYSATVSTAYVASWFAPPPQKPKAFRWDRSALRRALDRVKRTTRLESKEHWGAAYGRLETAPTHEIKLGDGRVATIVGYGHMNAAPAQLVSPTDGFLLLKGK